MMVCHLCTAGTIEVQEYYLGAHLTALAKEELNFNMMYAVVQIIAEPVPETARDSVLW